MSTTHLLLAFASLPILGLGWVGVAVATAATRQRRYERTLRALRRLVAQGDAMHPASPAANAWRRAMVELGRAIEQTDDLAAALGELAESAPGALTPAGAGLDRLLETPPHRRHERWRREITGHLAILAAAPASDQLPGLTACLFDAEPRLSQLAALWLGRRPDLFAGAAVPLATAARDAAPEERHAHLWALCRILAHHPGSIALFEQDPEPAVRRAAVAAIGRACAGSSSAQTRTHLEEVLTRRVLDTDAGTRRIAWRSVASLGPLRRTDRHATALLDQVPEVRLAAVLAFAAGDSSAVALLVRTLPRLEPAEQEAALEALSQQRGEIPQPLWELAREPEPSARRWTLEAMGSLGTTADVARLAPWLADTEAPVRAACSRALAAIATRHRDGMALQRVLPELLGAFRHEADAETLVAIAEALQLSGARATGGAILGRLETVSAGIRERLLETLAKTELQPPAVETPLSAAC